MYPDVVIIGGGIVGCACAYYLARAGVKARLLEAGPLGSGASRAGMSHIVTWEEPEPHLHLARASNCLYRTLGEELGADLEYRLTGSIAIVEQARSMEGMTAMIGRLQAWGLECRLLSREELLAMEPGIAPDVAGGAYFPKDAQVNPLHATRALARRAKELGASVEPFAEVIAIEQDAGGRVQAVRTPRERVPTGCVVNAAGAWAGQVAAFAGLDIPIQPRKGTLVVTAPVPEDAMRCKVILAAGYMDAVRSGGSGVAVAANVQQVHNGNLLLGSSRQFVGFDTSVDSTVVGLMVERCLRFFPGLAGITAIRVWAGLRPYTPDLLPMIGPAAEAPGLFMAAGHEGIGITEAPITGLLISQMITGAAPEVPVAMLTPDRLARGVDHGDV
jgi:glycine/D-amino acid oxidase-like deaminating enzyme